MLPTVIELGLWHILKKKVISNLMKSEKNKNTASKK